MEPMSVTAAVFHLEISALNSPYELNRLFILVTRLTSQSLIGIPLCRQLTPVGSAVRQLSTAAFSAARSAGRKVQIGQGGVPSAPTPVAMQGLCASSVMALAPVHISSLLMTAITFQLEMSWLKSTAS